MALNYLQWLICHKNQAKLNVKAIPVGEEL